MPPIKRNSKPAAPQPARRRLAGHGGPTTRPEADPGENGSPEDRKAAAGRSGRKKETASPRRRPTGRALAYAALTVGVVAGVVGGVLATEPGVSVENRAFVDKAATDEVMAAATTSVQRLVAIDHETLDEYHASLGEFLTPNLVDELEQNWPALRDSYEQTKTAVDANVSEAGVAYLADGRAEVLLVQDVSMTRDGAAAGSTSGTYLVALDKVDGVWKLSRIPDLPS